MIPELGVIEARFGRPWTWAQRTEVMTTLARAGYRFYHYGPKGDPHLRRAWRTAHSAAETRRLATFGSACRAHGLRFGVALTPIDASHPFDAATRAVLAERIAAFDAIGIDDLAILFDDLRGDLPGLARSQADIVDFCGSRTRATRLYFCPTYYSDDPILDCVFGQRPSEYLPTLGRLLDPAVRIYWTGEEVCSREIRPAHLRDVADRLGRQVCLWDNYPVNDGARMSRFLNLRAFTGRPAEIAGHLVGHAVNPAMQPLLTCLPALTLAASYRSGPDYRYGAAFAEAGRVLFGAELTAMLQDDLIALNDMALERLGDRRTTLRDRYAAVDHPAAREVVGWLDGDDLVTDDEVQTQ